MHAKWIKSTYMHTSSVYTVSPDEYTHKHAAWKHTLCIQTLMRTDFLQQSVACSKLSMMKWIWLINRNRNSITLYVALFQAPRPPFLLHDTLPPGSTSPDFIIIIHSPSSTLHLSSLLLQSSSSSFLFPPLSSASQTSAPPSGVRLKTHADRQWNRATAQIRPAF